MRVVPGHPIAGREKSGIEAADGTLFVGQKVILTPTEHTDSGALDRIRTIWRLTGASVMYMSPSTHDQMLALTSHLPHMIAYALVNQLADQEENDGDCLRLAAGGFYDLSRVASSDPVMWRDVYSMNKDAVLEMLGRFTEDLSTLQKAIRNNDTKFLEKTF